MRLDKESLDIIKNNTPPILFRVRFIEDELLSIEESCNDNIYGNVLVYAEEKDYVFDIAYQYKDRIDYLFFVNTTQDNIEIIAKPKKILKDIEEVFDDISLKLKKIEKRKEQVELSNKIKQTLDNGRLGIFEAPTGTGKSLAYLVPSILYSKKNRKKVVISTNTINLQKQLMEKDIPILKSILDFKAKLALGRGNYLCKRKLDVLFEKGNIFLFENDVYKRLKDFARHSNTGLKSDFFSEKHNVDNNLWDSVGSSSKSCAHSKCKYYKNRCFYYKARQSLESADLIVANHHIVLSDALLGEAKILPDYNAIVFDEAHNLEKNATNYFTKTVSTAEINRLLDRFYTKKRKKESGLFLYLEDDAVKEKLKESIIKAKDVIDNILSSLKVTQEITVNKDNYSKFEDMIRSVINALNDVVIVLKDVKKSNQEERLIDLFSLAQILEENISILLDFDSIDDNDSIKWIKVASHYVHFNITPLDVADYLKEKIYANTESSIFISATISVGGSFDFFKKNVGIDEADEFIVKTNFDYENMSRLIILKNAPQPNSEQYTDFLSSAVISLGNSLVKANIGSLVLFTSYKMLNNTYDKVYNKLKKMGFNVLKQGDFDNFSLLEEFKDKRGFLFATSSFWEGIDVKGDALSVVFIVRLPFEVPNTPIEQSRYDMMERQGINSFFEYSLPKAVLKFRQGFGRLIRSKDDKGVIIVSDSRIVSKSYGRLFIQSLPKIKKKVVNSYEIKSSVCDFFNCC